MKFSKYSSVQHGHLYIVVQYVVIRFASVATYNIVSLDVVVVVSEFNMTTEI
jgi:hypothetical protein